jgi:hypothetical protein
VSATEVALWVLAVLAYAVAILWLVAWVEPRMSQRQRERRR